MGRLVKNQASARTGGSYGRSRMYEVTDEGKEDKDKESLYHIIDTFIAKKKLKDNILSLAAQ